MKKYKLLYILPAALLFGCEPEFEDVDFNGGSADFSSYVSVGNSLTAGYQNNALKRDKQEASISAMLAGQFREVGGGEFKQPLMDPGVGLGSSLNAEFGLYILPGCNPDNPPGPTPQPIAAQGQLDQLNPANFVGSDGPFNNVGVPGAKSFHLLAPGYGNIAGLAADPRTANPFYVRFCNSTNSQETVVEAAMRASPTFFSLWIGNNDVLGYSTTGGEEGDDMITPTAMFSGAYKQTLAALTSNGAEGVIANIPYVTSIPYFTTVPNGTDAITEGQAAQLNAGYAAYNAGLDQVASSPNSPLTQAEADRRKISFEAGNFNTFVVLDPNLTDLTSINPALVNMRQSTLEELMVLVTPGDSLSCFGMGTATPIPGKYHINAVELDKIKTAIDEYNVVIKNEAETRGLAFVDANARLQELASSGIAIDGINFNSDFIAGGAFSLDGVHPSTRGYAIIANDFIAAINAKYGANVPSVVVSSYPAFEVVQ